MDNGVAVVCHVIINSTGKDQTKFDRMNNKQNPKEKERAKETQLTQMKKERKNKESKHEAYGNSSVASRIHINQLKCISMHKI